MWTIVGALLAYVGGVYGMSLSEKIKTDDGIYYAFSKKWVIATGLVGAAIAGRLLYGVTDPLTWALFWGISVMFAYQFIIDVKYNELANEYNLNLLGLTAVYVAHMPASQIGSRLGAFGILTAFFFLWWFFSSGLGFGDVKFIASTSLLLTVEQVVPYLVATLSLAILYGVVMMLLKKKTLKSEFAFGPFLIVGMLIIGIF